MKKSKYINLVLITAALASCRTQRPYNSPDSVYDGSILIEENDSTYCADPNLWIWYYALRPYGTYNGPFPEYLRKKTRYAGGHVFTHFNNGTIRGGFGKRAVAVS